MEPFAGFKDFLSRPNSTTVSRIGHQYVVRHSPNKGEGVFARRNLAPGTVIMEDRSTCHISKSTFDMTDSDILAAYTKLSASDQRRFMTLHESHRPFSSQICRIYKGNANLMEEGGLELFLDISKINHSCVPNAEIEDEKGVNKQVIATNPIAEGEEVFISYKNEFQGLTKFQRSGITKAYFGFECNCPACSLCPEDQHLSDERRKKLLVIMSNLDGFEALDPAQFEALALMTTQEAESEEVRAGFVRVPLARPLSDQQKVTYLQRKASLLEAENLIGQEVSAAYFRAAMELHKQISRCPVMLKPSIELLKSLMDRCISTMEQTRGVQYKHLSKAKDLLRRIWLMGSVDLAFKMFNMPLGEGCFAIHVEKRGPNKEGHLFEEAEYLEKVRKGELPAAMSY